MNPLDRFRHLERRRTARRDAGGPQGPAPRAERFEGVERPSATPLPAPATGASLGRFGPAPEPSLELADTAGARPFTRCARCGTDSHAFATACPGCGARLDTPDQHAFDERLRAAREAEAAREEAANAGRRALQARDAADQARARRALAEAMAREVGEHERRRLDAEYGGWGGGLGRWGGRYDPTPLGLRLLRLLPGPGWRLTAGVVAAAAVLALAALGLSGLVHRRGGPLLGLAVFLALVLIAPPGRLTRRWWL
ncbi:hypothetical protein [Anaeromyxobacter oryzisoli]|uniref:hypothetical protein n=1 Tax=Anaeromyxobacter oryzisoli TaxID=2925408 RepID=UPI001F584298|nr:hypothetical protein [Anaeromyxobacter sp. SG63]